MPNAFLNQGFRLKTYTNPSPISSYIWTHKKLLGRWQSRTRK